MMKYLLFIALLLHSTSVKSDSATPSKKWLTLSGNEPAIIARGGFSGLFPESSSFANQMSITFGSNNVILHCDLQLTKDGVGFCLSDINLQNSTTVPLVFPNAQKTYNINGQDVKGWFALDFTSDQLFNNVSLNQNIFSRPNQFDGTLPLTSVEDATGIRPPQFWLNVQYDMFYTQHKLSPASYVQKALRFMGIQYISSPEIGFLKSLSGRVNKAKTKLIFRFLNANATEPTTKQTYGSILRDLSSIKSFASGILVPKEFIWPVEANGYLGAPTSLVKDAHSQELEVYAFGFANDNPASYNYSYDPTAEYLQFVNNSEFSVDGVFTDFPPTAAEAIECFTLNKNANQPRKGQALVISHNGASGVYAGCTDLAYQEAVDGGADIIDCSVQMSKDGVAFCSNSVDLVAATTAMASFMSRSTMISEIQKNSGIFSFDLTWDEIQTLKPQLTTSSDSGMIRNPASKNQGKFVTLIEFLEFAKKKAVPGILINIENASYLASKKGLSITDAVAKALSNATFDKQSSQRVLIQSDDSSVLSEFKNVTAYKRVLSIKEAIGDIPRKTVDEIKKFADAITVTRSSIMIGSNSFLLSRSNVVKEMHAANISVYVSVLRNEFVFIAFDYFSDPIVELATFVVGSQVDGVVTEYPATARAYLRSPCSDLKAKVPYNILPAEPGSLLSLLDEEVQPPAKSPAPLLEPADVVDPPLPPLLNASATPPAPPPQATHPSSSSQLVTSMCLSLAAMAVLSLFCMGY